jgi:hypothetical protein
MQRTKLDTRFDELFKRLAYLFGAAAVIGFFVGLADFPKFLTATFLIIMAAKGRNITKVLVRASLALLAEMNKLEDQDDDKIK